ncbi:MAG TPA: hypothetical protein VN428_13530 [Bryobacteraceae bacterium]|nr:hypothetical protein [Bryobacteraceae bacterium]
MPDTSQILLRFNRLMRDVETGKPTRNCFLPWEVELLLDLDACEVPTIDRRKVLSRYRRAAGRRLERGAEPLKLSEYLRDCADRRTSRVS